MAHKKIRPEKIWREAVGECMPARGLKRSDAYCSRPYYMEFGCKKQPTLAYRKNKSGFRRMKVSVNTSETNRL